jgi:hypothetical protein
MPGSFPGIPGIIAFAGVKFVGYCLAGVALRRFRPSITASVYSIAAARTGLGILIGPPLTIGLAYVLANMFPKTNGDIPILGIYTFIYAVRILIWALVINHFVDEISFVDSKLWGYATLGALWSCLLDLPGFGLAIITPGQVPIC